MTRDIGPDIDDIYFWLLDEEEQTKLFMRFRDDPLYSRFFKMTQREERIWKSLYIDKMPVDYVAFEWGISRRHVRKIVRDMLGRIWPEVVEKQRRLKMTQRIENRLQLQILRWKVKGVR